MNALGEVFRLVDEKRKQSEHLLVVLDGACLENAFGLIFSLEGVEEYLPLFIDTRYEAVLAYGPVLARVQPGNEFFRWFFHQGAECYAGGFFFSSKPLAELAEQFKAVLEMILPDNSRALMRFYDPRMTKRSLALMEENDRAAFCEGISAYFVPRQTARGDRCWNDLFGGSPEADDPA